MMFLAIVWVVLFLVWVCLGFLPVASPPAGPRLWGPSVILAILLAILAYIVFGPSMGGLR